MTVLWGLTKETICGLMNTAPWPLSAGAFNASVGAGLPSSKTLAKADFFTGNPCRRTLKGSCVYYRGLALKLRSIFFSNAAFTLARAADLTGAVQAGVSHQSASKHVFSEHTHKYTTSTRITSEGRDAGTSCAVPSRCLHWTPKKKHTHKHMQRLKFKILIIYCSLHTI